MAWVIYQGMLVSGLALIVGMQPVLTAIVAVPLLGERLRPVQLLGLAMGVAGMAKVDAGHSMDISKSKPSVRATDGDRAEGRTSARPRKQRANS